MPRPKKGDAALRSIKAYIQEKGWTQGRAVDHATGAVCLSYACWNFKPGYARETAASIAALNRLYEIFLKQETPYVSLPGWNDHLGRTVEDVYALIDQTIKEG